jgi:hypothetical protein
MSHRRDTDRLLKIHRALITVIILLIAGCSVERNVKLDARLPLTPVFRQIPLHIGVYYSPEFIEYTRNIEFISVGCGPNGGRVNSGFYYKFPVGTASTDLFDQIVTSMFTTVTRTSAAPPYLNNTQPVDGILEPLIESFEWYSVCPNALSTGIHIAQVNYVVNFYNGPDGKLVASLRVSGKGSEKLRFCLGGCKDSIASEQAMQDAMAMFMIDFQERQEVRQWLSSHAVMPGYDQ